MRQRQFLFVIHLSAPGFALECIPDVRNRRADDMQCHSGHSSAIGHRECGMPIATIVGNSHDMRDRDTVTLPHSGWLLSHLLTSAASSARVFVGLLLIAPSA
jgi:hypothetical protein